MLNTLGSQKHYRYICKYNCVCVNLYIYVFVCRVFLVCYGRMDTATMAMRERERLRAPDRENPAMPVPANRRGSPERSPRVRHPTAGGRDGMVHPGEPAAGELIVAKQGSVAPCGADQEIERDWPEARRCTRGIARDTCEGVGEERHSPPDHSKAPVKSHQAQPVEMEHDQSARGVARATGEHPPHREGNRPCTRGLARDAVDGEATSGRSPAGPPTILQSFTQALPATDRHESTPGLAGEGTSPDSAVEKRASATDWLWY